MQSIWLELVKSVNEPLDEVDIERALKKIQSECALKDDNIKEIISFSNCNTNT
mgnify:FL=1